MDILDARWTYACTRCDWKGDEPDNLGIYFCKDCPDCGNSCTTDEPSFEPCREEDNGT